ncbi:hypothetical protein ACF3NW_10610 [Eikenella halliae]|uniref:hypothetical protein n=1 Tax=Eikenella halliae TaxID=1795832 RepID=UPI0028D8DBEF|nr:hypothetical protein [Eikenella halliae]
MITTRDVLFLYSLFHWGILIVLAIAACVIFYLADPEFVKKYPFLVILPGVLVFGSSYIGDLREKAKMERRAKAEEAEWHKRYDPAKARFDQLCQNAGERIYRTADNVDGILLLKVRGDDEKYQDNSYNPRKDQMWEDAAVESEFDREAYIEEFLLPYTSSFPRYIYADVLQKNGLVIRYSRQKEDQNWVMDQQPTPHPRARYAVTYENDISWENRKHWIVGTTIKIIDTKTNELMAEKTMYAFVPALGYSELDQNPNPWGRGMRCPSGESEFEQRTVTFAIKVLIPSNLSRRLQND